MMQGKLRAASRLINDNADSFPLSLDATVTISGKESTVKEILLPAMNMSAKFSRTYKPYTAQ